MESTNVAFVSSTSILHRVGDGMIMKCPANLSKEMCTAYEKQVEDIVRNFEVERKILELLGDHPRTVKYRGWQEDKKALLFVEASHSSLQLYLDHHGVPSQNNQRKWSRQVIKCLEYIHRRGVIHCDIRPENFLVHATSETSLDVCLCDFGGSSCEELGLDGLALPTPAFLDPAALDKREASVATDIFSLGFVLYFIQTGHWPFRGAGFTWDTREEADEYEQRVQRLYRQGKFPDVDHLFAGRVMVGCWTKRYMSAEEALCDWDFEVDMERFEMLCPAADGQN
ncbi:kinase-like domain-containing protein [Thelonectria olida]|uniref:EKC/KEOPS complex subunit BUD32 n=1 Tax=Thelonectria olida TaxID=1576542 RepID=A0A9P8VTD9_9HYPO|nr:kinase-like domain-containing protein [Thelonectria olida]